MCFIYKKVKYFIKVNFIHFKNNFAIEIYTIVLNIVFSTLSYLYFTNTQKKKDLVIMTDKKLI